MRNKQTNKKSSDFGRYKEISTLHKFYVNTPVTVLDATFSSHGSRSGWTIKIRFEEDHVTEHYDRSEVTYPKGHVMWVSSFHRALGRVPRDQHWICHSYPCKCSKMSYARREARLVQILRNFDWYYMMSDDGGVYLRGSRKSDEMREFAATNFSDRKLKSLWKKHAPEGHKPPKSKAKAAYRCGVCGRLGHNARTCEEK